MSNKVVTAEQSAALTAAFAQLVPLVVGEDSYVAVTDLHQLVASVLFPNGVQDAAQYDTVKYVAETVAAEHGYAGETQLQPPQVGFDQIGRYVRKLPELDPATLTDEVLGAPRFDTYQPIHYYIIQTVQRQIAHKLHGSSRSERQIVQMLNAQVDTAMQAAGWERTDTRYQRQIVPALDGLQDKLTAWLGKQGDKVTAYDLTCEATKLAFGKQYTISETAESNAPFEPVLAVLPKALTVAKFETVEVSGFYRRRPLDISAETGEGIQAALDNLTAIQTAIGKAIVEDELWEAVAKQLGVAHKGLTYQQKQQLLREEIQPWLTRNRFKTTHSHIEGYRCEPQRSGYFKAYAAICNIEKDPDHQIAFGRGDKQALPVFAPLQIVDESKGDIVCLQMIGNPQAVKANWAKLMSAYQSAVYLDGTTIRQRGMKQHVIFKKPLPLGQTEWVLLHKQASFQELQPGKPFYLLDDGTQEIPAAFFAMLDKVLAIPLQPHWTAYLWHRGRERQMVQPVNGHCYGLMAWRVDHGTDRWEKLVTAGFESGELVLLHNGEAVKPQLVVAQNGQTAGDYDDNIISVYTVGDAVADGVLADVATLPQTNERPAVMIPFITKFPLGRVVVTQGALDLAESGADLSAALARHASGDWGEMDAGDKRRNDSALNSGDERIFSSYVHRLPELDKSYQKQPYSATLWIITEWDRSVTTIMDANDY